MQFSATRTLLLPVLQAVIGVVERRQTMPVLSNVLVDAADGRVVITATDLELELVKQCEATVSISGSAAIPARKLLDICRGLPESAEIEIEHKQDRIQVRSGLSRFSLATMLADDWPDLEDVEQGSTFELPQAILKRLLDRTHFAMAQQDVRYYLNGLFLSVQSERVRAVATDGHRLALSDAAVELPVDGTSEAIVPRKAVAELVRLLEPDDSDITLRLSERHLRIQLPGLRFTTKLIDGRFPDYERVIPDGADRHMEAAREPIRQALARTAILANEKLGGVRLSLAEHTLKLQAQNAEREQAEDEIQVKYDSEPLEIGFNVRYLLDALSAIDSEAFTLALSGPDSSGVIQAADDPSSRYVVMPMRL